MLRRFIKHKLAATIDASRILPVIDRARGLAGQPLVVGYHQVVRHFLPQGQAGIPPQQISVAMLERHLDWMGERYEFVSLDHIGAYYESGEGSSKPLAAVTFDDGYRDVYLNAFPLLKRKGIPATVFVVTNLVGTDTALLHDRLHAALALAFDTWSSPAQTLAVRLRGLGVAPEVINQAEQSGSCFGAMRVLLNTLPQTEVEVALRSIEAELPPVSGGLDEARPMTWDMLREMSQAGITIGSHTKSHILLPVETSERQLDEVMGSKTALERSLVTATRHFAYPDGRFDARTAAAVAISGYRFAYTTCRHQLASYPLMTIPRRMLWERSSVDELEQFSPSVMSCQVSGLFDWWTRCVYTHDYVNAGAQRPISATRQAARPQVQGGRES
jgi:peptidoglycan/xylan/chitin deacetylase (PgdA/CDA1 family)